MTDHLAGKTDELKKKRFFWGISLAWIPAIPFISSLMLSGLFVWLFFFGMHHAV